MLQPNVFPAFGTIPRYLRQNSTKICILIAQTVGVIFHNCNTSPKKLFRSFY